MFVDDGLWKDFYITIYNLRTTEELSSFNQVQFCILLEYFYFIFHLVGNVESPLYFLIALVTSKPINDISIYDVLLYVNDYSNQN